MNLEEALTDPIIHTRTDISKIGRQILLMILPKKQKQKKILKTPPCFFWV